VRRLLLIAAVVCLVGVMPCGCSTTARPAGTSTESAAASANTGDDILARAFAEHITGLEVVGQGTVTQLLSDDTEGARHQRFVIRLGPCLLSLPGGGPNRSSRGCD